MQKTNKLAQFKQWILSIIMWRYFLLLFVAIPTPIFVMIDPKGTTPLSIVWIVSGCIILIFWYKYVFNATNQQLELAKQIEVVDAEIVD